MMETLYYEKYFINPAIEYGIRSYIKYQNGNEFKRAHTFEMHVIKALTIIYGEKSILLPYKIDNEKAFECNLLMYDLKESDMKNFIKYMNEYYIFMKNFNSNVKATGLISEIEKILIEMINKRSKKREFTQEELAEFDTIFNPIDGDLKKIKSLLGTNDGLIQKTWTENKYELSNTQLRMIAVNPNLLMPEEYSAYGYDIRSIAMLSEEEIKNINKTIVDEMIRKSTKDNKTIFKKKNRIILTCGNGFVDKLMLLSIIATELMVGIVIATIIGG